MAAIMGDAQVVNRGFGALKLLNLLMARVARRAPALRLPGSFGEQRIPSARGMP